MNYPSALRRLPAIVFLLFVISASTLGHAQTSGVGNITGTITDTSGAIVPSASVLISNTDTGVSRTVTTDASGSYAANFLQPGHYDVIAGGGSYGKVNRKGLLLTVGQTMTVDAALPAASASSEITVSSEMPILDPEKTEVSQTIGQEIISNLPVNNRNWSSFVLNTPNVVPDGGSGLVSFRGISGLYNQNYVDGANNNQMLFSEARGRASGAPYVYSLDSIKEFQAETSNYSVEFGQAAGGQVNAVTKSGTNAIHGDLFYYLRYPSLNALDPQTKWAAKFNTTNPQAAAFLLTQPIHQQQQFGGSVGGPIIKDRLFYFFTYDGFRRVGKALYYNNNIVTLTPTPTGTSGGTIISPTQCPTTITSAQCTSAINFILNNAFAAPTRFAKQDIFFPRIDWHINSKNDMFVNYNWANFQSTNGYNSANTVQGGSPSANGPTYYHERFLVAGLTTQVSSRSINQVHFQYGRDLETAGANAAPPSVGIGTFTYGMPNALPRTAEPDEHRTQITDVFSTTHGHHTFKFGGDVNIVHEVMINLFQGGGLYNYSGASNAINFANWAADSFAGQPGDTDSFAGYHYSSFVQTIDILNPASKAGLDDFWMKMWDAFAEDSWKIRQNVTLTAGIRWDLQLTPNPIKNNTNFPPISPIYSSSIKNTNRIQPRIAIAWQPYSGTVVRAGYGLFSGLNQGSTYYAMRVENGVIQVNYNFTGCASSCSGSSNTALRFPNVPFAAPGPPLNTALIPNGANKPVVSGSGSLGSQSFHGLDPNFVPPYAHEAELGIEQALPGKMSLSVGYVGTRGMRLPIFVDSNLRGQTPHGARTYNILDASGALVRQMTVPVYLVSDRIIPALLSYNTGFSVANTWYNSMAVSVRRPFANGVSLLANYTWSHSTDTGQVQGTSGTFYGGDTPLDPNNPRRDNGNSDIDVRNRFVMSFVYQPKIMQDNFWVRHILDDFMFSGGFVASGGQPIFLSMNNNVYQNGASTYGSGGNIYGGAISSSSGSPTTGRPPQIGRNSIYAPGFNNLDFRISRDFPIYENIKLQFVGEAFNLLNRRIITGVVGTHSVYTAAASAGSCNTATQTPGPTTAPLQGCIAPFIATGASAFGAPSSTSNSLVGPRQLQVSAKLFF